METLATVDWLITCERVKPTVAGIRAGIRREPAGDVPAKRKDPLFGEEPLRLARQRWQASSAVGQQPFLIGF